MDGTISIDVVPRHRDDVVSRDGASEEESHRHSLWNDYSAMYQLMKI